MDYELTDPEIVKTIVFSTAHITAADSEALHEMNRKGYVYSDNFAHRVILESFDENKQSFVGHGLSHAFFDLIETAKKYECNKVEFDSDGPVYDCVPVFDW
jgi:hypothetical protein